MARVPSLVLALLLAAPVVRAQDTVTLASPGGSVTITVGVQETLAQTTRGPRLHYAVQYVI